MNTNTTSPIALTDLLNIADYEKARPAFRKRVMDAKQNRRISVGPIMTFVFENRETVLFQIQEMMRTERLVHDDQIQHEIETYRRLLPSKNELSATLLIEITEKDEIRPKLDSLVGLPNDSVFLLIGDMEIPTIFDEEQSEDGRISAVQYVRWKLDAVDIERMRLGQTEVGIRVRHANYDYYTKFTDEQLKSIAADLTL
jgi:hypothetical protein